MRENRLRDPSRVTVEDVAWFIDHPGIFVWVEGSKIVGFSAADPRNGGIFALFVEEACESRGIGRALLERACKVLDEQVIPGDYAFGVLYHEGPLFTAPETTCQSFR